MRIWPRAVRVSHRAAATRWAWVLQAALATLRVVGAGALRARVTLQEVRQSLRPKQQRVRRGCRRSAHALPRRGRPRAQPSALRGTAGRQCRAHCMAAARAAAGEVERAARLEADRQRVAAARAAENEATRAARLGAERERSLGGAVCRTYDVCASRGSDAMPCGREAREVGVCNARACRRHGLKCWRKQFNHGNRRLTNPRSASTSRVP
jgi:hypothetical protein